MKPEDFMEGEGSLWDFSSPTAKADHWALLAQTPLWQHKHYRRADWLDSDSGHLAQLFGLEPQLWPNPWYGHGPAGCGKTHWLKALCEIAHNAGYPWQWISGASQINVPESQGGLLCIDDIDCIGPWHDRDLFQLFNQHADAGGIWLATAKSKPEQLVFGPEVRSRLGWGLVQALVPLPEADKPQVLMRVARDQGVQLSYNEAWFVLEHGPRDLSNASAIVEAAIAASRLYQRPLGLRLLGEIVKAWPQLADQWLGKR